jgi:HEPN domain-containing protein/RimJ/RimL family protein N-acetyltransferase
MSSNILNIAKEWLKFSFLDLENIKYIITVPHLTSITAFHAQQSIEKSLKALLSLKNIDIPKIHSLNKLFKLTEDIFEEYDTTIVNKLDKLYTSSRYPSEFGLLPDGQPSTEEAQEFYEFALSIYEQVKNLIEQNNVIIQGKSIKLRLIEIKDAEFILSLRLDSNLNKHLSSVNNDLNAQIDWIKKYKEREIEKEEYYFIIESLSGEPYGTVRLYDFRDNSFCWGSWIIKPNSPSIVSIQSTLLVYQFAFYTLHFEKSHFDVRKENLKVIDFHKRMGGKIVSEDELNYYFEYLKEDYEKAREKYKKFL